MKYHVNAFFGWIRFSEIVSPDETEEYSDDQEWFPKGAVLKNDNASGLATATHSPR